MVKWYYIRTNGYDMVAVDNQETVKYITENKEFPMDDSEIAEFMKNVIDCNNTSDWDEITSEQLIEIIETSEVLFDSDNVIKYYRVYANCVTVSKPVLEISKEAAVALVINAVYDCPDYFRGHEKVDWDNDADVTKVYEQLVESALQEFKETGTFCCGDYEVVCSSKYPQRPNKCGYDAGHLEYIQS